MGETNLSTEQTLSSLSEAVIEDLTVSFAACNPLEFARHLHSLDMPDAIKGELLRAKVNQKPKERDDAMQNVIESAMSRFWSRLGNTAA
jgi:hypothetical protein